MKRCILYTIIIFCHIYIGATGDPEKGLQQAVLLLQQRKFKEVQDLCNAILLQHPSNQKALLYSAMSFVELNNIEKAQEILTKLQNEQVSPATIHICLAKIALKNKKSAQAIEEFKKALIFDPKSKDATNGIVEELKEQLRTEEAIPYLQTLLTHYPNDTLVEFALANTLNMAGHSQEALDIYLKLHARHPLDPGITYNIAYTYKKLGMLDKALPFYAKALQLNPNHQEALFSQGLAHIILGDWEKGWEGYEHRSQEYKRIRKYDKPEWKGEDLVGKTIFVYGEQGLGDSFQFCPYLRLLKEKGAYVIFAPQQAIQAIMQLYPYADELIPFSSKPAEFDYHISLMSLPYVFKTRIDTVHVEIPYLYADKTLVKEWREKLSADKNIKIGICWQGNSNYSTAFLRAAVAGKSMPASYFEPLSRIPGVTLYSLQRVTGTDQEIPATMKLVSFDADFDSSHGRFMDTAAVIKNLDLVISIDTSICHFAAALGCPVWNILPEPSDWRWMINTNTTPWYPNMRLWRQPTPGDWHSVIADVTHELIQFVAERTDIPVEYLTLMTKYRNDLAFLHEQKQHNLPRRDLFFVGKEIETLQAKIDLLAQLYYEDCDAQAAL